MSEANNLQAPWTTLPEINRFAWKKNPTQSEQGGGRRSGLLNIKQPVSGETGKSCGDAVSDPISISCSPARLQQWLHSDFYSTRQATSGAVTLFRSITPAVLYTNHDMMHLCLSHPWRRPCWLGEISVATSSTMILPFRRAGFQQVLMRPLWSELIVSNVVSALCVTDHRSWLMIFTMQM